MQYIVIHVVSNTKYILKKKAIDLIESSSVRITHDKIDVTAIKNDPTIAIEDVSNQ